MPVPFLHNNKPSNLCDYFHVFEPLIRCSHYSHVVDVVAAEFGPEHFEDLPD
jgi:hypothetical protein